jgi:hypothetical protein
MRESQKLLIAALPVECPHKEHWAQPGRFFVKDLLPCLFFGALFSQSCVRW